MELKINDIGRVGNATIQMHGITVVAGANGTGKSTVSKSLYAVLEMANDLLENAQFQKKRSLRSCIRNWNMHYASYLQFSELLNKTEAIYNKYKKQEIPQMREKNFINEMSEYIKNSFQPEYYNERKLKNEIRCLYLKYCEIADKELSFYCGFIMQTVSEDVFFKQVNCLKDNHEGCIQYTDEDADIQIRIYNNQINRSDVPCPAV